MNEIILRYNWENLKDGDIREKKVMTSFTTIGGYASYYQTAHFSADTHEYLSIPTDKFCTRILYTKSAL